MATTCPDKLPPGPFQYMVTARPGEHEGKGHVYVIDASGRKIAVMWGTADEKLALAGLMIAARDKAKSKRKAP